MSPFHSPWAFWQCKRVNVNRSDTEHWSAVEKKFPFKSSRNKSWILIKSTVGIIVPWRIKSYCFCWAHDLLSKAAKISHKTTSRMPWNWLSMFMLPNPTERLYGHASSYVMPNANDGLWQVYIFNTYTLLISTKVHLRLMGLSLDLVHGHEPKHWTNSKFDLLVVLSERLGNHSNS